MPETAIAPAPEPPFKYIGGDPGVDLVNTVDWTRQGPKNEHLTDYARLTRWAAGAGVLSAAEGTRLRRAARARPEAAEEVREHALGLRSVLQRVFRSVISGDGLDGAAWEAFNEELTGALGRLRVSPTGTRRRGAPAAVWDWQDAEERLDSFLWPVVRSAAELLASDEAAKLKVCGGPDCGWMYVDRSRNRLRRWCEMETCGTAAKTRRRRERAVRRRSR